MVDTGAGNEYLSENKASKSMPRKNVKNMGKSLANGLYAWGDNFNLYNKSGGRTWNKNPKKRRS